MQQLFLESGGHMQKDRYFSFTRLVLAMLILSPVLGILNVISAYRNNDLKDALTVISIYLVAAPLFALWWLRRHPASDSRAMR